MAVKEVAAVGAAETVHGGTIGGMLLMAGRANRGVDLQAALGAVPLGADLPGATMQRKTRERGGRTPAGMQQNEQIHRVAGEAHRVTDLQAMPGAALPGMMIEERRTGQAAQREEGQHQEVGGAEMKGVMTKSREVERRVHQISRENEASWTEPCMSRRLPGLGRYVSRT